MKRKSINALKLALAVVSLCAVVTMGTATAGRQQQQSEPSPTPTPGAARPQGGGGPVAELLKSIAGREEEPAEKVFKNVQVMKGVPAGRFLRIMQMGYARSLGVRCDHCHVPGQWESDEKATKGVAREMILMTRAINDEHLKKIKNLRSAQPAVNCTTCHRGETKPALNLPDPARPAQPTETPQPPQPVRTPGT